MQTAYREQRQDQRPERRTDLDWIRIGAFGLLILYHAGMYYATWGWHVKSAVTSRTLDMVMLFTNPWRLGLLFLVSGCATRFMMARLTTGALARGRSARLLPPLAFGMLVVVAPQAYYEVVEKLGYPDGWWAFYVRYLKADQSFCPPGGCIILPTWNHLWFVAYLWAYTMVLAAVLAAAPGGLERAERWLEQRLAGTMLLILPIVVLAVLRVALQPIFGSTHALVDDWYNHAVYFPLFALGFLLARASAFWSAVEAARWPALVVALAAFAAITTAYGSFDRANPAPDGLRVALRVVYGADQWAFIVAILGFGRRWLSNADGPLRRYLTDAIFPFYIVHQTVIVVVAHHLKAATLPIPVEAAIILGATALACLASFEMVRRVGFLRPIFGLKPAPAGAPARVISA
jgi:peptidoglycan/LPS O-acetylase OafA/YrhL